MFYKLLAYFLGLRLERIRLRSVRVLEQLVQKRNLVVKLVLEHFLVMVEAFVTLLFLFYLVDNVVNDLL
jgi:hypothetical protein